MKVTSEIIINAPIGRVFEVFSDIEHAAERIQAITRVEILSQVREGKGTRWRETRKIYGKEAIEEMEITDFQPNKRYTVEANSHGTLYITVFEFTAVKGGTKVTIEFEGRPITLASKAMSALGPLIVVQVKKGLDSDLKDLKTACEDGEKLSYMAGYSGKPLLQKLGYDTSKINYVDKTAPYYEDVKGSITLSAAELYDFIHIFVKDKAELARSVAKAKAMLSKTGVLWVSWPKKSSKIPTDLDFSAVQQSGLRLGLVDNKVAAVDDTWSGLKFVYRRNDR